MTEEIKATSNFYLGACFLMALGTKLVDIDRNDPRHIVFVFSGENLTDIEHQWDNKVYEVNARDYADAIREMKMKIHQK